MSTLDRRLQILLDDERYQRLQREALESGRSVAGIIREAIDLRFSTGDAARIEAGRLLIAEFSDSAEPEPDWSESKVVLDSDLGVKAR